MEEIHKKRHLFLNHSFYDIYTNDNIFWSCDGIFHPNFNIFEQNLKIIK